MNIENKILAWYMDEVEHFTCDLTWLYCQMRDKNILEMEYILKTGNQVGKMASEYGLEIFLSKYEKSLIRLMKKVQNGLDFKTFIKEYFNMVIRNYKTEYMNNHEFNREFRELKREFGVY